LRSVDEESELDVAFCGTAGAGGGERTGGCSADWLEWELDDDFLAAGPLAHPGLAWLARMTMTMPMSQRTRKKWKTAIRSRPQVCAAGAILPLVKVSAAGEPRLGMVDCLMTSARRQLPVGGQVKQLH
jgi:hypothetical protein